MSEKQSAVDLSKLNALREAVKDGEAFMKELIQDYLALSLGLFSRADQAVVGGKWSEAVQAVHSLKSSSAQMGAWRVAEICERLEKMPIIPADSADQMKKLKYELDLACEELTQRLA